MKLEFSRQFSEISSNIKFHENPSIGSRVVPCGQTDEWKDVQTDMTKLIAAFRNFTKPSKSLTLLEYRIKVAGNVHEDLPTFKSFVLKM